MKYPAIFTPDNEVGGFVVTFRDIPEAINLHSPTKIDRIEEAMTALGRELELTSI